VCGDLVRRHFPRQIHRGQAGKLLPGVTEPPGCRFVESNNAAGLDVQQPDRIRGLGKHCGHQFFPFPGLLLRFFALGDVPADADDLGGFSLRIGQQSNRCLRWYEMAVLVKFLDFRRRGPGGLFSPGQSVTENRQLLPDLLE